jgi:DNA transformation protein and related proteins
MDRDFLSELFSEFGPVTLRRMFSGYGISVDGVNFALALRSGVYLRADETSIPRLEAEGSKPFQYQQGKTGKVVTVNSYWELPARLFDDLDELADWARTALAAAQRAAVNKRPRARKTTKAAAKAPASNAKPPARKAMAPAGRVKVKKRASRKQVTDRKAAAWR